ncbi:hypothetical protein V5O48_008540 [Marasmius crinis-equi]|uniref:Uncharacterized protein n=1 Tax=Marasmius crinis-equi TaxID=585013 RepID=A0ABR3FE34_9AGAR
MEDDDEDLKSVPPWVDLEYAHMRTLAGPESRVYFTNLSKASAQNLDNKFRSSPSSTENVAEVSCRTAGILDIIKEELGGSLDKVCLLDPKAEKELSPEDGDGRFEWFLFGNFPTISFNSKESVEMPFSSYLLPPTPKYVLTLLVGLGYMVEGPSREPLLPPGMRKLLHEDLNKSFDF